jgi:two-component system, NarL family, invasion response regulator UvrY
MSSILIVDDHTPVRHGMKSLLVQELPGTVFGEASDGREALAQLRRRVWDVVSLDLSLPDVDGLEFLGEIRRMYPRTSVVVVTLHPESQYAVRALRAGASAYVTKDSPREVFVAAFHKVLSGGKYITISLAEQLASAAGPISGQAPHEQLSNREFQVLCGIASGKRLVELAQEMNLSIKSVSTYRMRVLQKMGMQTNADLTGYAVEYRLI